MATATKTTQPKTTTELAKRANVLNWLRIRAHRDYSSLVEALEGEVTDEVENLEAEIARIDEDSAESLAYLSKEIDAEVEEIKAEKHRLDARSRSLRRLKERTHERLLEFLGEKKRLDFATISVRRTARTVLRMRDEGPAYETLPEGFRRTKVTHEPKKKEILAALKLADKGEGDELAETLAKFADLATSVSLTIK